MDLTTTPKKIKIPRRSENLESTEESDSFGTPSEDDSIDVTPSPCARKKACRNSSSTENEQLPPFLVALDAELKLDQPGERLGPLYDPLDDNALILYEHEDPEERFSTVFWDGIVPVVLDPDLAQLLREEQKEGLQFLFNNFNQNKGCILAHLMGAGKCLTCISLIHVLLEQKVGSPKKSKPALGKVVLVVPKTLVTMWELEFEKWLVNKGNTNFVPKIASMSFRSADEDQEIVEEFLSPKSEKSVLILSYERFTKFQNLFLNPMELIFFDEAHLLKNRSQRSKVAEAAPFRVKVLLTGTPVQNTLEELFRLVDIAQPGALLSGTGCGSQDEFKRNYINPFSAATLTRNQYQLKEEDLVKLRQLKTIINPTMQVRENPVTVPKHEMIICLELAPLQKKMYGRVCEWVNDARSNQKNFWYSHITLLRTICSHPKLALKQVAKSTSYTSSYYKELKVLCYNEEEKAFGKEFEGILSQKLKFIKLLVNQLEKKYIAEKSQDKTKRIADKERLVIVSNYTAVLDMVKKFLQFNGNGIKCLELYGSTRVKTRDNNIELFNDKNKDYQVFLLSLKAGGAGVTLTGANHLIILDPDWNPANDEQAMARIWRHGQTHPCYIYRLVCTGTVEEVISKRQLTKKELDRYLTDDEFNKFNTLPERVRELFELKTTKSAVHDAMNCTKLNCLDAGLGSNQDCNGNPNPRNTSLQYPDSSAGRSFGDYALVDPASDDQDEISLMNPEIICDISSLAAWDHFQQIEHLPPPGLNEDEIPILRRMWQHNKANTDLRVPFSFVFYRKVNPVSDDIRNIRNGEDVLDYYEAQLKTNTYHAKTE